MTRSAGRRYTDELILLQMGGFSFRGRSTYLFILKYVLEKGELFMQQATALPTEKKHIVYFDYLESIAIFFVVSLHQASLASSVVATFIWYLYRTCIPLFFMVHGALLLERKQTLAQIGRRIRNVLLQLFAWNLVYLLLSLAVGLLQMEDITLGLLYRVFLGTEDSGGIPSYHLWFSYALISVYLFLPILQVCRRRAPKILGYITALSFLLTVVRVYLSTYGTFLGETLFGGAVTLDTFCQQINPFGQYSIYFFYFPWGWYLYRWAKRPHDRRRMILLACGAMVIGMGLMVPEQLMAHGGSLTASGGLGAEYQRIGVVLMASGIFLLFSQLHLEHCLLNRAAKLVSSHTLDIYYIHMIFAQLLLPYVPEYATIPENCLRALIVLLLSLGVGLALRRVPLARKLLA